jgi:hypothetical protein
MLAADAELEVRLHRTPLLHRDLHQRADTFKVDRDEGVLRHDPLLDVKGQEFAGIVA